MAVPDSSLQRAARRGARRRRGAMCFALVAGLLLAAYGRPVWHVGMVLLADADNREQLPHGFIDDASHLNKTRIVEVLPVEKERVAAEKKLAQVLRQARERGLRVSIAGSRHSMGGHSIAPSGIVVNMLPFNAMELDEQRNLLHVQAGARWSEVIPYLEARGRSVAVMQSDNSFSIGGSLSANCHGWQFGKPPIASTVESFRIMRADGVIVRCSRTENRELFSLALGGYGLFGIILDVDLRVVPNERYRLEQFAVPLEEALATFRKKAEGNPEVAMVYARMNIIPSQFLKNVILHVISRDPAADGAVPRLCEPSQVALRRALFRGSAGSEYGKELRWQAEMDLQPLLCEGHCSRNQLLN